MRKPKAAFPALLMSFYPCLFVPRALVWRAALAVAAAGLGAASLLTSGRFGQTSLGCLPGARPMARVELLFGTQRKNAPPVGEDEWAQFLENEVTSRFPDGVTVFAGQGQWRSAPGAVIKE